MRRWIDARSFERGQGYFRTGRIRHPRRQGGALKAECEGSMLHPYHVKARLGASGIASADCSCPVGDGGHCKHVAALLLTWINDPGAFSDAQTLQARLDGRSKEDLIRLIAEMIGRHPTLEMLVELPIVRAAGEAWEAVEPETIRRQVRHALLHSGNDWQAGTRAARNLDRLVKLGDDYGISDAAPAVLAEETTADERVLVAGWTRKAMKRGSSDWARSAFGNLLLDLEAEVLDDEAYLQLCREAGLLEDLVIRLLALGRTDDALTEAQRASDYALLHLTGLFAEHGHAAAVAALVKERQAAGTDVPLTEWLRDYAQEYGDPETALDLSQQIFRERPSLPAYTSVRTTAQAAGRWNAVRADLLGCLETHDSYNLLTRIYLEEKDIDRALETVQQAEASSYGSWSGAPLCIEVARAAEDAYPDRAADLYLDAACTLIEQRGRSNYAQAAEYLGRIRTIYGRTGHAAAWATVIDAIREDNSNLPALQDELSKAGL